MTHLRELTITFDLWNKMNFLKGGMIPLANGTLGFVAGFLDSAPKQESAVAVYDVFE